MFTGTTTVSLAMLPTVEKVVTLEIESYLEQTNRPFFEQSRVSEKIDIRIGDALSSLDKLIAEKASFDMVGLDRHYSGSSETDTMAGVHRRRQEQLYQLLLQDRRQRAAQQRWFYCCG